MLIYFVSYCSSDFIYGLLTAVTPLCVVLCPHILNEAVIHYPENAAIKVSSLIYGPSYIYWKFDESYFALPHADCHAPKNVNLCCYTALSINLIVVMNENIVYRTFLASNDIRICSSSL